MREVLLQTWLGETRGRKRAVFSGRGASRRKGAAVSVTRYQADEDEVVQEFFQYPRVSSRFVEEPLLQGAAAGLARWCWRWLRLHWGGLRSGENQVECEELAGRSSRSWDGAAQLGGVALLTLPQKQSSKDKLERAPRRCTSSRPRRRQDGLLHLRQCCTFRQEQRADVSLSRPEAAV